LRVGDILAEIFEMDISTDILPDGKMYYNIAERVVGTMMKNNYDIITDVASEVQKALNEKAGIGIKAIQPELNQDRIDGIVNKLSEADAYDDVSWLLGEPIVNFSQSIVDDCIKANADFQYRAGLSPKIVRTSTGKCCDWCNQVVGTYEYHKVKNTGNNVFRRHRYCRCTVEYVPGDGKKQDVWTKEWRKAPPRVVVTEDEQKRIRTIPATNDELESVMPEYLRKATPGEGSIEYDDGYIESKHKAEIKMAQWLHDNLGGDILLLQESGELNVKMPDYIWRGKLWELKNITTAKAADNAVRNGLKQIAENPGGIILELGENEISLSQLQSIVNARIKRTKQRDVDLLVIQKEMLVKALRYKK